MKKYVVIDNWKGDSDPIETIEEAVGEAESRIPNIRLTRREFDRYKKECENFIYIAEVETSKPDDIGVIVASVEITPEKLGRFY